MDSPSSAPTAALSASDNYVVLARKYRPQVFADLIGQEAMVATLRNAFASGRIAQGFMLTGVRGVGKTTTARILARGLNFEPAGSAGHDREGSDAVSPNQAGPSADLPRDPADYGVHCAQIMASNHPDVLEMDAASNTGVDNIRELIESARYKPLMARYKVFIIDEVHMLSKGAFNALLKTLEEPPDHVKFIFATTEIRKVPVTVLSRCQRFDLRRVGIAELVKHFTGIVANECATAEPDALRLIARAAGGSVRDGLSILDQAIAFSSGEVTAAGVRSMLGLADGGLILDLLELLFSGQSAAALTAWDELHDAGADPVQALTDTAEAVHAITRIKALGAAQLQETMSDDEVKRCADLGAKLSMAILSRAWQMLLKGIDEAGRSNNARAAADMVIIRIAYTADLPSPEDVIKILGAAPARQQMSAAPQTSPAASEAPATANATATAAADQPTASATPVSPASSAGSLSIQPIDSAPEPPGATAKTFQSFDDILSFIGQRRDAKLKFNLEEHCSLVAFDGDKHKIDLYLYPEAPQDVANALRERLNEWTASRWVVVVSPQPGERPVAVVRREQEEQERQAVLDAPEMRDVLDVFPDAKLLKVRDAKKA